MEHENFGQIYLAVLEKKLILLVLLCFSSGSHLGFSTTLNFLILKLHSPIMPHVKFENHGCSGFRG